MFFVTKYPVAEILSRVEITAIDRDGNVLWVRDEGRNKLVNTGRQMMSRLLGGSPGTTIVTPTRTVTIGGIGDVYVKKMQFGSGGHNPATSAALGVSPSDEYLNAPLTLAPKDVTVSYPGTPPGDKSIEFLATIDYAEANGDSISEFGLFTRLIATDVPNALMFAKKNFGPPIVKNASFKLEFRHRIIM